jgi:hypothetical protein
VVHRKELLDVCKRLHRDGDVWQRGHKSVDAMIGWKLLKHVSSLQQQRRCNWSIVTRAVVPAPPQCKTPERVSHDANFLFFGRYLWAIEEMCWVDSEMHQRISEDPSLKQKKKKIN